MDPFTLILQAIAGGGRLVQGFASSAAAELQGNIAGDNARMLEQQAQIDALGAPIARARSVQQQQMVRDKLNRTISGQQSFFAAGGLDPAAGSPLLLAMQSAMNAESDLDIVRAQGALDAANAMTRSAGSLQKATAARYQQAALKDRQFTDIVAGLFGAATAFLSPAGGRSGGGPSYQPGPHGPDDMQLMFPR